jgi:hypothetical protein
MHGTPPIWSGLIVILVNAIDFRLPGEQKIAECCRSRVRCLHVGTNADDATITAAANSPMGELLVPLPAVAFPAADGVVSAFVQAFWWVVGARRGPTA